VSEKRQKVQEKIILFSWYYFFNSYNKISNGIKRDCGRVDQGISPQASHKSLLESLPSHGSSNLIYKNKLFLL